MPPPEMPSTRFITSSFLLTRRTKIPARACRHNGTTRELVNAILHLQRAVSLRLPVRSARLRSSRAIRRHADHRRVAVSGAVCGADRRGVATAFRRSNACRMMQNQSCFRTRPALATSVAFVQTRRSGRPVNTSDSQGNIGMAPHTRRYGQKAVRLHVDGRSGPDGQPKNEGGKNAVALPRRHKSAIIPETTPQGPTP